MEIRCTQCGASLSVAADARLLQCQFCGTALVVEAEGALFHEVMLPTVAEGEVEAHLRRFLAGDATVAGLDREARLGSPRLEYFPFWAFTVVDDGGERVLLQPAAPSSLQGLHGLTLPAGSTRGPGAQATDEAAMVAPELPVATARESLLAHNPSLRVERMALYHLPMYRIAYSYRGRTYQAAVEAVSGRVLPADYPAKAEAPYILVAVLALLVFGLEGLVVSNVLLKAGLYLLSAVPIMAVAWLTSRKV